MRVLHAILLAVMIASPGFAGDGAEAALVQVIVTFQETDPFVPWQMRQPGERYGYGIAVGNTEVITTENLVRNHRLVEIRRATTGEKIKVSVETSDCEVNLAFLKIPESKRPQGVKPVEIAERIGRKDKVEILQFDETSQIQHGDAKVLQIDMVELPTAPYQSLTYSLLTDLNVNGEGAPAILDGKLAGLMMSYNPSTRTGHMVPVAVIRRFLADTMEKPYTGFASAGFFWMSLVDPAKRAYLNVRREGKGILVLSCVPGCGAADSLKPNDVILECDGFAIDNLGFYEDPDFGRLDLAYICKGRHKPGDVVPLRIVRDKAETTVNVKMNRYADETALIPEDVTGAPSEYLVTGGFVIRELTGRYLRAHGIDWERYVDPRLVHLYARNNRAPQRPGEHVVLLSGVLPDPINVGYQQRFQNALITSVNGQPVVSMADVFRVVDTDKGLERIKLQSVDVELVLDRKELPSADERLQRLYRIPSLRRQRAPAQ